MYLILYTITFAISSVNAGGMIAIYANLMRDAALDILDATVKDNLCGQHLRLFIDGISDMEPWALEMLDSSEKVQSGYLTGNLRHPGNFDECTDVGVVKNETFIQGKHCVYLISSNVSESNVTAHFKEKLYKKGVKLDDFSSSSNGVKASSSACVPLSCTGEDLQLIWNHTENMFGFNVHLIFKEEYCEYKGRVSYDTLDILFISATAGLTVIITLSTLYDVCILRKKEIERTFWSIFSLYSNAKSLFYVPKNFDKLNCLKGIRVITMAWVILCHTFLIHLLIPNINAIYLLEWKNKIESMVILGASVAADTFFLLGGLTFVYKALDLNESEGKFNVFYFVFKRILRLAVPLVAILCCLMTIFKHFGSGPYWHIIYDRFKRNCDQKWWATLLFFQNIFNPIEQCMPHAWYLSVDVQLFSFGPILLIAFIKWPRKTLFLAIVGVFCSVFASFLLTWLNNFGTMPLEIKAAYHRYLYQATYIRMCPWLIGAMMGYFLFKIKNSPVILGKKMNISLWVVSLATMAAIVFGQVDFTRNEKNVLRSSIFNAFATPSWCLAVSYIIFSCSQGYGGPLNKFLSNRIFQILSRLTYSMFLMHLGVLGIVANGRRNVTYFSNMTVLHDFWGDYVFSVGYAVVWTLLFESPLIALQKLFSPPKEKEENVEKNITVKIFDIAKS